MKVTYHEGDYMPLSYEVRLWVFVGRDRLGLIAKVNYETDAPWKCFKPNMTGHHFRTRDAATSALIDSMGDIAWCSNCKSTVVPEGTYDHEFGGHDHCPLCGEHTEEITP